MSFRLSLVLAVAVAVAVALLVASMHEAGAHDEVSDPVCAGSHGLESPLPDRCLGVIDTDRPHQTDTPHVVPAGHVQIESALGAIQLGGPVDRFAGGGAQVVLLDDNYKVGLVSGVDLQLIFAHAAYVPATRTLLSPGPLQVRAKFNVVEDKGGIPAVTLVPWVFLPVAPSERVRGGPLIFWGWELPAHLELEMNAGVFFGTSPKPPAALVLASALTYTVVGDFRVFIDIYATGPDIALGTGALWALTRDMQVDFGTYAGLNGDEPRATPFLGFSIRR